MPTNYQTPDTAAIVREAHRMRDQAVADSLLWLWRGTKRVVVTTAGHVARLGAAVGSTVLGGHPHHR